MVIKKKPPEGIEPTLHWGSQLAERKHVSPWRTWDSWSKWWKQSPSQWKWELHHLGGVWIHQLFLLANIFWPLPTLQRHPVLNFVGLNETTTWLRWVQTNRLVILHQPDWPHWWQSQGMLLYWPTHKHLRVTSLGGAPLVDSSLWGKPHWKLTAWTRANQAPSSSWLQHATLCPTFLSHRSHARVWTETWGEGRRKMGKQLGKASGKGREEKENQVWAIPCHQTSTGCLVPDPSLAVWVPAKRSPRGRSCSCNAPHGAELRRDPSPAAASTPTSASAKKPKTHRVTEAKHPFPQTPLTHPQTACDHVCQNTSWNQEVLNQEKQLGRPAPLMNKARNALQRKLSLVHLKLFTLPCKQYYSCSGFAVHKINRR